MKSLFIDTSSFFMFVSVLENQNILFSFQEEMKSDMASRIIPTIQEAFESVPFDIYDIDRIYVVNGPGSFTGIRVGVTAAKMIACFLKKEIVTVSSLEFLATTPTETEYKIPMIDARRGYVYAGVYDANLNVILKDQYLPLESLEEYKSRGTFISRDKIEGSIFPKENIPLLIERHLSDPSMNPHAVNPNYLKLTEAEEKRMVSEQ